MSEYVGACRSMSESCRRHVGGIRRGVGDMSEEYDVGLDDCQKIKRTELESRLLVTRRTCSLSHGLEKARVGSWQMPNAMPMPMDGV
jgi:hypothetical protein